LGTLRFPQGGTPALTLEEHGADGNDFKAVWDKLLAQGKISVKIHENRDDERPLIGIQVATGDPRYGRLLKLKMKDDYGYDCNDEPTSPAR
jgi:hypothetical protein